MLGAYGTVLTEHIGDKKIVSIGEQLPEDFIFKRDTQWVREADVVVSEVTTPSLGVGYELGLAESLQKPILCLYRPSEGKKLSAMIAGNKYFKVLNYSSLEGVSKLLESYFRQ